MGNKKDIGKAYKEQLEGYASSPHNRVWGNIEAELKKSKRRVFPIWKTLTGLGILLLLSSLGIYTYYSNSNDINTNTEQSETTTKADNINNDKNSIVNSNDDTTNTSSLDFNDSTDLSETTKNGDSKTNTILNQQKTNVNKTQQLNRNTNTLSQNNNTINTNSTNVGAYYKNTSGNTKNATYTEAYSNSHLKNRQVHILELLNTSHDSISLETYPVVIFDIDGLTKLEGEKKKEKKKKPQKKQNYPLTFSAYVSPTYTNVFGKDSSIDALLNNNKIEGGFNINYGISATIKLSEKSSLRLGLGSSEISYTIKAADTTSVTTINENDVEMPGGFLINSLGYDNLTINSQAFNSTPQVFGENTVVDFEQKFKYLEVPVDYIYHLKDDSKLKINLVGGLSALFLYDQSIIAKDSNGNSIEIGKAENLKDTNFSINLGGNLSYSLSKKLSLDVEPTFKYYLSTFSTNGNSKPYGIGLRFGINYRF